MGDQRKRRPVEVWGRRTVGPGETRNLDIEVTESYSGIAVKIPLQVRRGLEDGPAVFVTAALHGDEINGTGAIRALIQDESFHLRRGALVLVPVLNILGFDRHSRYLPDRRDLNRSFPGSANGSLAGRMARVILDEIAARCDYGIDLHTAAVRRTNFPAVRADVSRREVRRIATAFGSEVILAGRGPRGCFRREACRAGCTAITFEGGEVWKVEPTIVESALRGIRNVLVELGMIEGEPVRPGYLAVVEKTMWVRAARGGFLQFHARPGDLVEKGQAVATNTSLLGRERNVLLAPFRGIVVGMTTLPAVSPGEPAFHVARLPRGGEAVGSLRERLAADPFRSRVVEELATNVMVVQPPGG
jgi:hypothetical protein